MSEIKEGTTLCPLIASKDTAVTCGKEKCEWWNERSERCSVWVIGDQCEDIAIAMKAEVKDE